MRINIPPTSTDVASSHTSLLDSSTYLSGSRFQFYNWPDLTADPFHSGSLYLSFAPFCTICSVHANQTSFDFILPRRFVSSVYTHTLTVCSLRMSANYLQTWAGVLRHAKGKVDYYTLCKNVIYIKHTFLSDAHSHLAQYFSPPVLPTFITMW